jgi:predicted MFS family arabinose efflux permease
LSAAAGGPTRARFVLLLALVLGLNSADTGAVGALADQLEQGLGISHTQLGLLATTSSIVGVVATLPVGVLADRTRRVRILVVVVAAWSVAMVAGGLATSYTWLLLSRLVLGVAVGAASPVIASLIGDLFRPADRARILGLILSGEVIGAGVGLVVAGDIGATLSWRYAFLLLGVLSAALAVLLARLLPEPARRNGDGGAHPMSLWRAVPYLLRIRTVRLLIVASSVGYFFFAGLRTFAVVFVERSFHVSQTALSALVPVVGAAALVGLVVGGRVTDARLHRGHETARVTIPALAYLVAALCFLPGLYTTAIPLALVAFSACAAALAAANPGLDAARLDIVPGALWGRAESLRTVLRLAGEAAAPVTFGFVADEFRRAGGRSSATGLRDAFVIMTIPLLANGLLVWMTRRTYPADVAAVRPPRRESTVDP